MILVTPKQEVKQNGVWFKTKLTLSTVIFGPRAAIFRHVFSFSVYQFSGSLGLVQIRS